MRIFVTLLIILTGSILKAQVKIENVDFKIQNNLLEIQYDLAGIGIWSVNVYYYSNEDSTWHGPLKNITGDIDDVSVGKNKQIKWNILNQNNKNWIIEKNLKIKIKLSPNKGSFKDSRDSTIYKWVKIGEQIWMAENLKATRYANGTPISIITDKYSWYLLKYHTRDKAYCFYENNRLNGSKYGVLYNWAAATNGQSSEYSPSGVQGLCPTGWHIPSDAEWEQLAEFIRTTKSPDVGLHLKSQNGWKHENGNDSIGFSAQPAGLRSKWKGNFEALGEHTAWWSTEFAGGYREIWCSKKFTDYDFESEKTYHGAYGFSVRCLKD